MMSAAEFYSKESLIRGQLSIFSYRRSSNTAAVQSDNDVDGSVIVATIQITVVVVQCLKENNKNYLSSDDSPAAIKVGRNLNKFFS